MHNDKRKTNTGKTSLPWQLDEYRRKNVERALAVADATKWQGDVVVNFHTAMKAARVLARELRLEDSRYQALKGDM